MKYDFVEQGSMDDDPLTRMLRDEEAEDEADILMSCCVSGLHRTKSFEIERTHGDMLGASPAEFAAQDSLH